MALFLRILEWSDDSNDTLVYKYPLPKGGREINHKSKIIVKESQQAIFVHKGQICEVLSPGTHSLDTEIFPILSKLAGWAYGFQTPISVDVYFINTKQFTGYKWGTANPIIKRDNEFGMIRVKGFGSYAFKVKNSPVFLNQLFGTNSTFKTDDIIDWLKSMLVSTLTDAIGESNVSVLDLAGNTTEFNELVKQNVQNKFNELGLELTNLFIENLSLPTEVEKVIDERTKLGILGDKTDTMMKIAAAEALKDAAKNPGAGGTFMGAGIGLGAGASIGGIFTEAMKETKSSSDKKCPSCKANLPQNAKFCPECGQKLNAKKFCSQCGAEINTIAKFCPECGNKI